VKRNNARKAGNGFVALSQDAQRCGALDSQKLINARRNGLDRQECRSKVSVILRIIFAALGKRRQLKGADAACAPFDEVIEPAPFNRAGRRAQGPTGAFDLIQKEPQDIALKVGIAKCLATEVNQIE
jgi:hypothetical protein